MKKIFLTFLILCYALFSFAKYAGFLGKHYMIHYDFAMSPVILNPSYQSDPTSFEDQRLSNLSVNMKHCLELEWSINKYHSVGAILHMFKSDLRGIDEVEYPVKTESGSIYAQSSNSSTSVFSTKYDGTISAYSFGLSGIHYIKGINPIGGFIKTEFFRTNYTVKVENEEIENSFGSGAKLFVDKRYHTYGNTFHFGRQKVYFNRLALRYGLQVGYVFRDDFSEPLSSGFVFHTANNRLHVNYLWNFTFGIGCLLF